jgi:hypothetical protein
MEALPFVPTTVNGVPFHPLVVHAVVVLLPLAVLGTIGIAVWPAMRRHLGLLVLAVAVAGLLAVPVAMSSGRQFRNHLGAQELVRQHQHYASQLLPWTAALVVALVLLMAVDLARRLGPVVSAASGTRPADPAGGPAGGGVAVAARPQAPAAAPAMTRLDQLVGRVLPARLRGATDLLRRVQPVLSVLSIALALVVVWYCYKTGDSGAKAVWQGR